MLKSDHPTLAYMNPGHMALGKKADAFIEKQKQRSYTAWQPPTGQEQRRGKKILGDRPRNDGIVDQELD